MTIVAAIVCPDGVIMGADSLASSSDLRVDSSTPKVYRFRRFLLGFAGSYGAGQVFINAVRAEPELTLKGLAEYSAPGNDWELLLADSTGVYEYQPGGGLVKMKVRKGHSYGVVGSGSGPALGSLYSWHDGREALLSALSAAEAHTNRVRRPFKIVSL